jgi:transposase
VKGVGELISLSYILTIEDPYRFQKSRDAGCFLVTAQPSSTAEFR